jgi:hypothetical protein
VSVKQHPQIAFLGEALKQDEATEMSKPLSVEGYFEIFRSSGHGVKPHFWWGLAPKAGMRDFLAKWPLGEALLG